MPAEAAEPADAIKAREWREHGPTARIAFVITGLDVGGAEISLLNILQHLDRQRFEPFVVSLDAVGPIGARLEAAGVRVEALHMRRRPLAAMRSLIALLRRERPALVQTWMYHADLLGGIAARIAGIRKVVWGIRNSTLDRSSGRATRAVVQACARLSRKVPAVVVSCSAAARDVHRALGYRTADFRVIPNGFDLSALRPDAPSRADVRRELGLDPQSPMVLHLGRFHPQKNHLGLMAMTGLVHQARPDVHFVLAGKDVLPANPALADALAVAGTSRVVHLLGVRDDVPRLLAAADLMVLSSSFGEAFPRVLGEALACGVPCVATDVGDSRFIVGDCGRIVAPGDPHALAEAVLQMLSLDQAAREQMSRCARERAVANFDIRAVTRGYERLYLDLLEKE